MVTLVGTESDFLEMLDNLVQLDLDAMEAYDLAIARTESADLRERLEALKEDHERHADELSALVSELGGKPTTGPATTQLMNKGSTVLADVVGNKTILEAIKAIEDDTNTAYDRAVAMSGDNEAAARVLRAGQEDERRHRAWIEKTLASL